MIKKWKSLDPMTRTTVVTCAVHIAILGAAAVAAVKLDKAAKTTIEN